MFCANYRGDNQKNHRQFSGFFGLATISLIIVLICFHTYSPAFADPTQINMEYVKVPETVGNKTITMVGKIYKPEGDGPFPLIVVTHGGRDYDHLNELNADYYSKSVTALAKKGFTVLVLIRRGYGKSEGGFNEGSMVSFNAALEGAKDVKAAIEFMKTKTYVDASKIVLLGKTLGGTIVMAASTQGIPGVIGAFSFGGGGVKDGDPTLVQAYSKYGKDNKVPTLWVYTTNDHALNYSVYLPNKMFEAYTKNGGKADYVVYGKWGTSDGHDFFDQGTNEWMPYVDKYLQSIGLGN